MNFTREFERNFEKSNQYCKRRLKMVAIFGTYNFETIDQW